MCQLHISLTRAAQIYLELHFCVELHTKKSPGRPGNGSLSATNVVVVLVVVVVVVVLVLMVVVIRFSMY